MHLIFRVHELRYLWLNSVFVVTFTVTTFMGGVVTFMGVCDTYGKLLDTYGSFVIFMGVVTFMGRTLFLQCNQFFSIQTCISLSTK